MSVRIKKHRLDRIYRCCFLGERGRKLIYLFSDNHEIPSIFETLLVNYNGIKVGTG